MNHVQAMYKLFRVYPPQKRVYQPQKTTYPSLDEGHNTYTLQTGVHGSLASSPGRFFSFYNGWRKKYSLVFIAGIVVYMRESN